MNYISQILSDGRDLHLTLKNQIKKAKPSLKTHPTPQITEMAASGLELSQLRALHCLSENVLSAWFYCSKCHGRGSIL